MKHGFGTQTYITNGNKYVGRWAGGKRDGPGVLTFKDGSVYDGEWKDDKQSGRGVMTFAATDAQGRVSYTGEWKDGKMHGSGKLILKGVTVDSKDSKVKAQAAVFYDGGFANDLKHTSSAGTPATERYSNGEVYTGAFVNGKRESENAQWSSADGSIVYSGPVKADHKSGVGSEKRTDSKTGGVKQFEVVYSAGGVLQSEREIVTGRVCMIVNTGVPRLAVRSTTDGDSKQQVKGDEIASWKAVLVDHLKCSFDASRDGN